MPEQTHSHGKLFLWLGMLVLALVGVSVFASLFIITKPSKPVTSETIRMGEAPRPVFTPAIKEKLRVSAGFQALVAHTDSGFEPMQVNIVSGQTVRFTNNSSMAFQLETDGVRTSIDPQDFYEHTYAAPGTYPYTSGDMTGVVLVQ